MFTQQLAMCFPLLAQRDDRSLRMLVLGQPAA